PPWRSTLSLHDALPILAFLVAFADFLAVFFGAGSFDGTSGWLVCKESRSCVTSAVESADCAFLEIPIFPSCSSNTLEEIPNCFRSEEHTSELQSRFDLV